MNNRNSILKPFIATQAKILIVDDSTSALKAEKDLMKAYGMDISTARSGKECLNLLNYNKYDIIFIDYTMPDMDGTKTALKIKRRNGEYFKSVIIIALTTTFTQNVRTTYLKNGFNDFLEKPIENYKLNRLLRFYLPRKYIFEINSSKISIEDFDQIKIKNVDIKKAIQNCSGNLDNYLSLLSTAYYDGKNKLKVIKNYVDNNDIQNYIIEIHSLKITSELIGDIQLSKLAKIHETAAANNDLAFIFKNIDFLLKTYDDLLDDIKLILPKENAEISPKIKNFTIEHILELLTDIAYAIDNFDLDSATERINHLLIYDLSHSQLSVLHKVKSYLNLFDYDTAYELITNLKYTIYK